MAARCRRLWTPTGPSASGDPTCPASARRRGALRFRAFGTRPWASAALWISPCQAGAQTGTTAMHCHNAHLQPAPIVVARRSRGTDRLPDRQAALRMMRVYRYADRQDQLRRRSSALLRGTAPGTLPSHRLDGGTPRSRRSGPLRSHGDEVRVIEPFEPCEVPGHPLPVRTLRSGTGVAGNARPRKSRSAPGQAPRRQRHQTREAKLAVAGRGRRKPPTRTACRRARPRLRHAGQRRHRNHRRRRRAYGDYLEARALSRRRMASARPNAAAIS